MRRCWPLLLIAAGCGEPDYAPVRDDLAKSAEMLCAAPPVRPPYGKKTRDVPPAELDAALKRICADDEPIVPDDFIPVRDALADERAIVGAARRRQYSGRSSFVDRRCDLGKLGLERKLLFWAVVAYENKKFDEAAQHCVEAVALVRESILTGDLIDMMAAKANVDSVVESCTRVFVNSPPKVVDDWKDGLRTIRATFPPNLHDVLVRDRAEMSLLIAGPLRDRSAPPMPCERAASIASHNDEAVTSRSDRLGVYKAWKAQHDAPLGSGAQKYEDAYAEALRRLDALANQQ